jgi:urease alpha subunit
MNVMTPAGKLRRRAAIGAVGLAALGGGGAAIAATKDAPATPKAQTTAIVTDAAGQLGVTPAALTAAIKKALVDQVEAELTAGTITQAEATAQEARINAADAPLFALGGKGGPGDHGRGDRHGMGGGRVSLDAAATYIGITTAQLRTQLAAGKSLATVATDNGKTAAGLKTALTTAATTELDASVKAGTLTQAQEDKLLAALPARLDDEINETHAGGFGGHDGPPPADPASSSSSSSGA